jgi:hypothetical protein
VSCSWPTWATWPTPSAASSASTARAGHRRRQQHGDTAPRAAHLEPGIAGLAQHGAASSTVHDVNRCVQIADQPAHWRVPRPQLLRELLAAYESATQIREHSGETNPEHLALLAHRFTPSNGRREMLSAIRPRRELPLILRDVHVLGGDELSNASRRHERILCFLLRHRPT